MKKEDNMTAEEFFERWLEDDEKYDKTNFHDCMIEFAKYHVEKALEAACENTRVMKRSDFGSYSTSTYTVDKDKILKAYPLENIK